MLESPLPRVIFYQTELEKLHSAKSFFCNSPIHSIHLVVPNAVKGCDCIHKVLTPGEKSYVTVQKVPLSILLEEAFISFVRKGSLWALTTEVDGIFDNTVSVTPPGKLLLCVTKSFYQRLGVHGSLCTARLLQDDRYEISIDLLSPLCHPGKKDYDNIFAKFRNNEICFNIMLTWIPTDPLICSASSIEDYFQSKGLNCHVCESQCISSVMRSAPVPHLDYHKPHEKSLQACSVEDMLEWIGMQACTIQWDENQEDSTKAKFLHSGKPLPFFFGQWRGMFAPVVIKDTLNEISKSLEMGRSIPYAVIFAHGFQDSMPETSTCECTDKIFCIVCFPDSKCWVVKT